MLEVFGFQESPDESGPFGLVDGIAPFRAVMGLGLGGRCYPKDQQRRQGAASFIPYVASFATPGWHAACCMLRSTGEDGLAFRGWGPGAFFVQFCPNRTQGAQILARSGSDQS